MRNPVAAAGATLTLILVAIIAWVFLNPGFAKGQVEDYVQKATGRAIEIKGGSSLMFRPQLAVRLNDVTLSNPEGQSGALVKAAAIVIPLEWRDLLTRQLRIGMVTMQEPVFNFTNDATGRASWTDPALPASNEGRVLTLVAEDGVINYLNEKSGLAFAIKDADFQATLAENDELAARGTASINGRFVSFQAYVKSLARAAQDGSPADFDLESPGAKIGFSGRLTSREALALAGQLTATADETRDFAKWLGATLPGRDSLGPFSLAAKLDSSNALLSFADAELSIGKNALKGKLAVDATRARPKLSGALATDQLNLPIPTLETNGAALKAFDTALELDAFRLKLGPFDASPAKIGIDMNEGLLDLHLRDAGFSSGKISGALSINGTKPVPVLQLSIDATGIPANEITAFTAIPLPNGPLTLKATLTASGKSTDELTGTLAGNADLSMPGGVLQGFDLKAMLVRLNAEAAVEGWPKIGDTGFGNLAANFSVADGIATLKTFDLSTTEFAVTGTGEADLLRRAFDLKFSVTEAQAPNSPSAARIDVIGRWDKPRFSVAQ
jgi:AsmA protein